MKKLAAILFWINGLALATENFGTNGLLAYLAVSGLGALWVTMR